MGCGRGVEHCYWLFPVNDIKHGGYEHAGIQGDRFARIAQAVQGLKPMADDYDMSIYQLVLTATLMHPAIQVAIAGIKTPEQVREAAAVMGRELGREDYFTLRKALTLDAGAKIQDASGGRR